MEYFFTESASRINSSGFTREESYRIVQRNAIQAWKENSSFYDKIVTDRKITNKIPVNKLKAI